MSSADPQDPGSVPERADRDSRASTRAASTARGEDFAGDSLSQLLRQYFERRAGASAESSAHLLETLERIETHTPPRSRYEEQGEIARGGMGAILRVWDADLRRFVAKKVLLDHRGTALSKLSDSGTVGRFLEEAQVTAQLEHPGIVPVHELGVDAQGLVYFTMRLVQGEDLRKVFGRVRSRENGWSVTRALGVLLKVCEAMAFAHSRGVLHRDLKPANVMVGQFGEVYVMDWGLARASEARTTPPDVRGEGHAGLDESVARDSSFDTVDGTILGTPGYMSPEQARGDLNALGPRSDVYALGAILYHLLTGWQPFTDGDEKRSKADVCARVQKEAPTAIERLAPGTPPELVAITERAMAREASARYADMGELAEDLRAYLENRVVQAHRTGALIEFRKWIARNKTSAALAAVLVGVVAASGFGAAWAERARSAADRRQLAERTAEAAVKSLPSLWPIHPDTIPELRAWLVRARQAVAYRADVERDLERFEAAHAGAAREPDPAARAALPSAAERTMARTKLEALSKYQDLLLRGEHSDLPQRQIDNELAFRESNAAVLALVVPRAARELELLEARARATPEWRFVDPLVRAPHERLRAFTRDLRRLTGSDGVHTGAIQHVQERLDAAAGLTKRTIEDERQAWEEALASIADPAQCPLYGGLRLPPQLGLVPLGRDARSGLWEFWHVLSGERPQRDGAGAWSIGPETGLVLVLVPGGKLWLGAQAADPSGPNYLAPEAGIPSDMRPGEDWMAEVEVAPFFLSKHEMTQGQWLRLSGTNGSEFWSGSSWMGMPRISDTHPLESVSWSTATAQLAHWSLVLPTEAQWERAARAGTQHKYFESDSFADLEGAVNLASTGSGGVAAGSATWDDGWILHAPVDTRTPNAFGFVDMLGNVSEWCADWYAAACERGAFRGPAAEHFPTYSEQRAIRGGSFRSQPKDLRISRRFGAFPDFVDNDVGVRPGMRCVLGSVGPQ